MNWLKAAATALLVLLPLLATGVHAQRPSSGWEKLAQQRIPAGQDRLSIDLSANTQRTSAIRLYIEPRRRNLASVVITYAGGQRHYEVRDANVQSAAQFETIDDRTELKVVERVDIEFEPAPGFNAATIVEVWGRTTGEVPRSVRSVSPPEEGARTATETRWVPVPIYYGTTRGREQDREKNSVSLAAFGVRFDQNLTLGRAVVTVPTVRDRGSIPRPPSLVFEFRKEDPARDFTVARVDVVTAEQFKAAISTQATNAKNYRRHALVFVHGFNVSFDDGLFRTAQIAHDLDFDGPAVLYSWPSRANLLSYVYDLDSAKLGRDGLHELLEIVAASTGVTKVNVIAHSLGNDPLLEVLRSEAQARGDARSRLKLNEIVLASPDVSAGYFSQSAGILISLARQGITLYASNNDRALRLSAKFRSGVERAGDVPRSGPIVVPGVESIDVSAADTSWFGTNHSAFADREDLIEDMRRLFGKGVHPPSTRYDRYIQKGPAVQPWWQYLKK